MINKRYSKKDNIGLPGGPNQQFTYVTGVFSQDMYHVPKAQDGFESLEQNSFNLMDSNPNYFASDEELVRKEEQKRREWNIRRQMMLEDEYKKFDKDPRSIAYKKKMQQLKNKKIEDKIKKSKEEQKNRPKYKPNKAYDFNPGTWDIQHPKSYYSDNYGRLNPETRKRELLYHIDDFLKYTPDDLKRYKKLRAKGRDYENEKDVTKENILFLRKMDAKLDAQENIGDKIKQGRPSSKYMHKTVLDWADKYDAGYNNQYNTAAKLTIPFGTGTSMHMLDGLRELNEQMRGYDVNNLSEQEKQWEKERVESVLKKQSLDINFRYGGQIPQYKEGGQTGQWPPPGFGPASLQMLQQMMPYIGYEEHKVRERRNTNQKPYEPWMKKPTWDKVGHLPYGKIEELQRKRAKDKKENIWGNPDYNLYTPEEMIPVNKKRKEEEERKKEEDRIWYGGGWRKKYTDGKPGETLPQYYERKCPKGGCEKPVMRYGGVVSKSDKKKKKGCGCKDKH